MKQSPRQAAARDFNWTHGRILAAHRHMEKVIEAVIPAHRARDALMLANGLKIVLITHLERQHAELLRRLAVESPVSPPTTTETPSQ